MSKGASTSRSTGTSSPRPLDGSGIKGEGQTTAAAAAAAKIPAIHFAAVVIPRGDGTYTVSGRPILGDEEISTVQACAILKISRSQIWYDRSKEPGRTTLLWRFTGPARRRILWKLTSVLAYKEKLKELGK